MNRRLVITGTGIAVAGGALASRFAPGSVAQTGDATPGTGATPELFGGVEVDPQMQELLDALAATEAPSIEEVTPQIARNLPSIASAVLAVTAARGGAGQEAIGGISHILVPGGDSDIVARVYTPLHAPEGPLPVAVYFHGGGFVIADLDTYDASCWALANASGALVVSVAYRQAPENPYPAAANDAYAATQWIIENAGQINGDPARVAVVGESAGGNLATVVCLLARDLGGSAPIHQVLVYPVATFAPSGDQTQSIDQFADASPLNSAMLEWFGSYYLPDQALAESDPYVSPAIADLTGLPPATVILAEIDPLHDQGEIYAQQLSDAGVDTTLTTYEGVTHEFFGTGLVVDKAIEDVEEAAGRLREAFGTA
jgi:acetyl esterase